MRGVPRDAFVHRTGEGFARCRVGARFIAPAHSVMKEDLAGGKLPSQLFGSNAAWWWVMVLAHNLNAAMKRLVLGEGWEKRRLKAIRYHLINLAGWVRARSRQLWIRLGAAATAALAMIVRARARMRELALSS